MLKQRLITALLLIPLVVAAVLLAPFPLLAVLLGLFVVLGAWEWAALSGWQGWPARALYSLALGVCLWFGYGQLEHAVWLLGAACAGWMLALYAVVRYQQGVVCLPATGALKGLIGLGVLLPAWTALLFLDKHYGPAWLLLLLALIWVADSGAYFAGRRWGRRKLAERVSPGKTWAGVFGALAASLLLGMAYAIWQHLPWNKAIWLSALIVLTVLVSILGDLLESLFKRAASIKDSGQLFPGHGGVLDRIDSLTAAAPFFALGLWSLEEPL